MYKKFSNILICVLVLLISILGVYKLIKNNNVYKEIIFNIEQYMDMGGTNMLYLTKLENCEECELQKYQIKKLVSDNNLQFSYINLNGISNTKIKKIYKKIGISKDSILPTIVVYKDKKLASSLSGISGFNRVHNFLLDEGLIKSALPLNYLNIISYGNKINSKLVLAIGNYYNTLSNSVEEILWNIYKEQNLDISFIYTIDLLESEIDLFESKLINLSEYQLTIPGLYIIDNGKIIAALNNEVDESKYLSFLKEYGIIS